MPEAALGPHPSLAPFLPEISAAADDIERQRRMPDDLAARMAGAGLFRILVPECYGGGEVHPRRFFDTLAATGKADGAVGWVLMIGATTGLMSASLPEEWSRVLYADNPDNITSGVTAPIGRAVPVDGGMQVTGRWPFGSGSQVSDWICGGSLIMENGEPRKGPHGPQSLLMFFPKEAVTIHEDTWYTSGLCGTGSHDIEVRDEFVPEGRWVELGRRARIDRPLYRFPTLGLLAIGVSAVAIGIAEHAIEHFIDLATDKVPTGASRSLANRPAAQKDLARAQAMVGAARAFTAEAIEEAWAESIGSGKLSMDHKAKLRLAATNNAWAAAEAVDLLYHAAGGSAIYTRSPLQRCFRDVHVATQHIMVAQPTYEVVGKLSLGLDPKQLL
jgi:alkylation response protein AidB-like acyl-CoA dehydrogenase